MLSPLLSLRSVLLLSVAGGLGLLAGACSAVLDFTECNDDSECSTYFTADNKPMHCVESQCVARSKCGSNSQCAGLGDEYICSLTGACAATTNDQCAAPIYADDKPSDDVIFIGSIVDKSGPDKDLGVAAEAAFVQALNDFHAGGGALRDGKQVAIIPCDSGGSVTTAESAAKHLGNNLNVPAILGPLADDEFTRIAEKVSVINGVLAYTNSPTAAIPLDFSDSSDLIWQSNVSVNIQGRAFGTHLKHEIDANTFGGPSPKVTLLFILDDYGYAMYYALATDKRPARSTASPRSAARSSPRTATSRTARPSSTASAPPTSSSSSAGPRSPTCSPTTPRATRSGPPASTSPSARSPRSPRSPTSPSSPTCARSART
jgi:hypothetical protein